MLTFLVMLGLLGFAGGCDDAPAKKRAAALRSVPTERHIEFVTEQFLNLYPVFCVYRSMPRGQKAALWQDKYFAHWVRWTGVLRSITPNGLTVRHLDQTVTFDVSVRLERDDLTFARDHLRHGDQITYVARLEAYDDVFQKLYLAHGVIVRRALQSATMKNP